MRPVTAAAVPATTGLYDKFLPAKQKPKLCQLIEAAIHAHEAMRFHLKRIDEGPWTDPDDAWQRLLDASFDEARQRLLDLLLNEHGVTSALAGRIGEIL